MLQQKLRRHPTEICSVPEGLSKGFPGPQLRGAERSGDGKVNQLKKTAQAVFFDAKKCISIAVPGGLPTETIRSGREESSRVPLATLGVISPWNPLATLSFHKENSVIAEGLVSLRGPGLESSERVVLCFCWQPSGTQLEITQPAGSSAPPSPTSSYDR